ncbi:hypothetical protein KOW79_019582 [Hemibagrus wyckioides]|uniref:G-protein coupled receptors family 1 profile domain-containing protein n=1 Tax=Hemibagrus wyckioides TaxID=337641 RepID=A0A9D3SFR3_9TELE|nr:hypothetical protein KOW79_019582 [Hemibagrus wyckioides]
MNSSSCNSSFQRDLLPPIYGVETCVALAGNILALWLLVNKERKNWNMGVVFSCNLIISDIFYALSLPLFIVYYSKGLKWDFGEAVCRIERFLFTCNLYSATAEQGDQFSNHIEIFSRRNHKMATNRSSCNGTFSMDVLPPMYGVEMCVALAGNILALWLLVTKERKNWHTGVVFSCNLVISDILYALTLPLLIIYYSKGRVWIFGNALCKIERFLFNCNLYVSIYFIMCISANRYLAIVHPFFTRNYVKPKHAKIASLVVWILVAALSSPILYYSGSP